jgi:2-furoyl-CoA dehydrogenase FAD binding subunit
MKPRPFDYARPDSADEAIALLTEYGDEARVLAGGQSLMAMMNLRLADPSMLIDIARIPELDAIRDLGGRIEVGAAVTQNKLLSWPKLADKLPLVAVALPCVGHFQTRNKGTVCGSIAHADPSSELPLSLALLEGEVVLRSKRGTRTVGARSFQIDMMTTAREPDELIIAVRFPVATSRKAAFREVARRHGDFAIIAIGAVIEDDKTARIGIGGIASKPVVRRIALDGVAAVKDAIDKLANELEGYEDLHASAELRRDILRNLAPVVIDEALACDA